MQWVSAWSQFVTVVSRRGHLLFQSCIKEKGAASTQRSIFVQRSSTDLCGVTVRKTSHSVHLEHTETTQMGIGVLLACTTRAQLLCRRMVGQQEKGWVQV
ncbi:hypothetical protein TRVL_00653 [Trypanosoma vivax]|nr:hypothetical protein TRVL_00653 [Trypanosoma vivax]